MQHRWRRRVRWWIFACLFGFAFFGYMQRTGVAIAAEPMMQELGFSQVEFGWLLVAFLAGYTVFQIPGGVLGEYLGSRRTLTLIGAASVIATCATALVPRFQAVTVVVAVMFAARFVLGIAQAALFPVASGAIRSWIPAQNWGFAQGLLVTGIWLGSAVTPPIVSALTLVLGWRSALLAATVPALLVLGWWQHDARDRPEEHPAMAPEELAELSPQSRTAASTRVDLRRVLRVLVDPQLLVVTTSYFLTNYVFYLVTFWSFLYLRQARHVTVLEGGWLASLPFLTAAVATAAGGHLSDNLIVRLGARWGLRALPLVALPATALFLWLTGAAGDVYLAVAALCLAFGCCELMEGLYWATAMRLAPSDAMAATAVLNTGGNLGGLVATPMIAALSDRQQWSAVFALGAATSLAAAVLWLWVDIARRSPDNRQQRELT
jgi:MFS transporter, ACS family, glucarate transporter